MNMITDPTLGWPAHELWGPRVTLCLHEGLPAPCLCGQPLASSCPATSTQARQGRARLGQDKLEEQCDLCDVPEPRQKLQIRILATRRKLPLNLIIVL